MLYDGELGEHFSIIHFDHALVDLGPARSDPGYIKQHWTMFPEWTPFDIVNKADGREIHIHFPLPFDDVGFGDAAGIWGVRERAFLGY